MSLALYMDVQVPIAITTELRRRGIDVLIAQDDGSAEMEDPALLVRATELNRVLFTMDEDFTREAARLQRAGETFAGIIYAAQLRVTIGKCIADLELISAVYDPEDLANRIQYLP